MDICTQIAQEMHIRVGQVETTVKLLDEGNTIPFIARYRKEATGSLDDTVLRDLYDRLTYLRNLQKRREEIASSIEGQEKMTSDIQKAIDNAKTLAELEDIYRPFKQKRRTRASIAKEKGLEPLASEIFAQNRKGAAPQELAQAYINPEKGVETIEDALQGASDIIAEQVSDDAGLRKKLRALLYREGLVVSKAAKEEDSVYATYYDFSQPVNKIAGHRVLAIDRGERENMLKVSIQMDENRALQTIYDKMLLDNTPCYDVVKQAIDDSYRRLIFPSLENEIRSMLTENASEQAIAVFSMNLRHLLMQPPVKGAVTLGLDPAYRTGCKIAVVDETGKVLDTTVIYPTPPQNKKEEAKKRSKH